MMSPSAQSDTQDRPEQFGSTRHSGEQPSNGAVLPSSQPSAPSRTPLPHTASVHTLGVPSHFLPSSTRQRAEQPSFGSMLPSSHCSVAATTPSPQRAMARHACPGATQLKPGSVARQVALQPSPDSRLPSSHASSAVSAPSPQLGGATPSPPLASEQLEPMHSSPGKSGVGPGPELPPAPMTGPTPLPPPAVSTPPPSSPPAPQPASTASATAPTNV